MTTLYKFIRIIVLMTVFCLFVTAGCNKCRNCGSAEEKPSNEKILSDLPPGVPIKADGGGGCSITKLPIGMYGFIVLDTSSIPLKLSAPQLDTLISGKSRMFALIDNKIADNSFKIFDTIVTDPNDKSCQGFVYFNSLSVFSQLIVIPVGQKSPLFSLLPPVSSDNLMYIIDITYQQPDKKSCVRENVKANVAGSPIETINYYTNFYRKTIILNITKNEGNVDYLITNYSNGPVSIIIYTLDPLQNSFMTCP